MSGGFSLKRPNLSVGLRDWGRGRSLTVAPPEIKVAVIGKLGVGKSALVVRFLTKRFITDYDPKLEDTYTKLELVDGREVCLRLMDTCDTEEKSCDRYFKWAHAFVVVFSITSRETFEDAISYLERLFKYHQDISATTSGNSLGSAGSGGPGIGGVCECRQFQIILVGNKNDLERYRTVSKSEAEEVAQRFDCVYRETSAADDISSVTVTFHEVIRDVLRYRERQLSTQTLYISEDKSSPQSTPSSRHVTPWSKKSSPGTGVGPSRPKVGLPRRGGGMVPGHEAAVIPVGVSGCTTPGVGGLSGRDAERRDGSSSATAASGSDGKKDLTPRRQAGAFKLFNRIFN